MRTLGPTGAVDEAACDDEAEEEGNKEGLARCACCCISAIVILSVCALWEEGVRAGCLAEHHR